MTANEIFATSGKGGKGTHEMGTILHITERASWESALKARRYTAPSIAAEGFIHCSTIKQAIETANQFYAGKRGLVLLCIDESKVVPEVKYEAPGTPGVHSKESGPLFPHLYGALNLDAVARVIDLPPNPDGTFNLPSELRTLL